MIRLQRVGKKHDPSYRVVLTDSKRAAQSGDVKEILGFYNVKKGEAKFSGDKIKDWIAKGAQVSGTVHNLLVREKVIAGPKIDVTPSKKKKEGETVKAEAKPAESKKEENPATPAEPAKEEAK